MCYENKFLKNYLIPLNKSSIVLLSLIKFFLIVDELYIVSTSISTKV